MHPPEFITYAVTNRVPAVIYAVGGGSLKESWDNLTSLLPSGLWWVLGIFGAALTVVSIVGWLWQSRHGGQEKKLLKNLPWIGIGLGLLLASPKTLIPVVLFVFEAIANVVIPVFQGIVNHLGS